MRARRGGTSDPQADYMRKFNKVNRRRESLEELRETYKKIEIDGFIPRTIKCGNLAEARRHKRGRTAGPRRTHCGGFSTS